MVRVDFWHTPISGDSKFLKTEFMEVVPITGDLVKIDRTTYVVAKRTFEGQTKITINCN